MWFPTSSFLGVPEVFVADVGSAFAILPKLMREPAAEREYLFGRVADGFIGRLLVVQADAEELVGPSGRFYPALWRPNRTRSAEAEASTRGLPDSNTKVARKTGRGAEVLAADAAGTTVCS